MVGVAKYDFAMVRGQESGQSNYSITNDNLIAHISDGIKVIEELDIKLGQDPKSLGISFDRTQGQDPQSPRLMVDLVTPNKIVFEEKNETHFNDQQSASFTVDLVIPDKVDPSRSCKVDSFEEAEEVINNPFARLLKMEKSPVRMKYKTYEINREEASTNFEKCVLRSFQKTHSEIFGKKFTGLDFDVHIHRFRSEVALAVLAKITDISKDDMNLPLDIVDRLRKLEIYSSSLDDFLTKTFTRLELQNFWDFNDISKLGGVELRGNVFFECASSSLEIGIAVWAPDPKTPGDYILSYCFGCEFEDTIHIVSHPENLEVREIEVNTR